MELASTLTDKSIADAMLNIYPTIAEAIKRVLSTDSLCAFDKQFAVCWDGSIFYKNKKAGKLSTMKAPTIKDIAWESRYRYLTLLLEGNYEKSIRDFGPTLTC